MRPREGDPLPMTPPLPAEPPRAATRAAGLLLRPPALAAAAAAFLLAAWSSETPLLLLAALFLSTALVSLLAGRLALAGVRLERRFESTRLFPGENAYVDWRLLNDKPLPLCWAVIENPLPDGIRPIAPAGEAEPALRRATWLPGRQAARWRILLTAERRGYYPVGPLRLTAGDPFGLYIHSRAACGVEPLLVYPAVYPVGPGLLPPLHPAGEAAARERAPQDPTLTGGVRPYSPGDGLKFLHWKATARRGSLQVKLPAATTDRRVLLGIAVETFAAEGADFELALSAAASLAVQLGGRRCPVGFFANTRLADSGEPACLPAAAGRGQLAAILEALAKATPSPAGSPWTLLDACGGGRRNGTTVVLIVGALPEGLAAVWSDLAARGVERLVLFAGKSGPPAELPPGTAFRVLRSAEDLAAGGCS